MSTNLRSPNAATEPVDGSKRTIALVCARFNDRIVERLETGARRGLLRHGVSDTNIHTYWVPGALEIPQIARMAVLSQRFDAVVALGTVIRGDTYHFEVVSDVSASGLMRLALTSEIVITNGILTVDNEAQALARSGDDDENKGAAAAVAALEALATRDQILKGR